MIPIGTLQSAGIYKWAVKIGQAACPLTTPPTVSATGRIVLTADARFVLAFQDALAAWVAGNGLTVAGELIGTDYAFCQKVRYVFKQAWLSGLVFPTLDASLDSLGVFTLTLATSGVTPMDPLGGKIAYQVAQLQMIWMPANFRLHVDGVDAQHVSHIDAFMMQAPGVVPNISLLAVHPKTVEDFLNLQKSGATVHAEIAYLRPNLADVWFTFAFETKVVSVLCAPTQPGSRGIVQVVKTPVRLQAMNPRLF